MTDTAERYTAFYSNDVHWMLRKDAPELVRDDLLPRVSSPLFFDQTVPAKAGASKSLWLADLPIGGENGYSLSSAMKTKHSLTASKHWSGHRRPARNWRPRGGRAAA